MLVGSGYQMPKNTGVQLETVESKIIEYFDQTDPPRAHTQEVAEELGITRHTAAKYLSVLKAKGLLTHDVVGNAKVWQPISAKVSVRTITAGDIDNVIEITNHIRDDDVRHSDRLDNLRDEVRRQIKEQDRFCLGAEVKDDFVGFIIGDERSWEFGSAAKVGWIRILGVHPDYQQSGVGQALGDEILRRFREADVQRVRTIVGWEQSDLLPFFHTLGFGMKESTVLEKSITGGDMS